MEEINIQTAKEVLQKEVQERTQKCSEEIKSILEKYKCFLDASITVTSRGNIPQITLIPKE